MGSPAKTAIFPPYWSAWARSGATTAVITSAPSALIGQRWEPDPPLHAAVRPWVRTLAMQSRTIVSMSILVEGRLQVVCGTAPRGHPGIPAPAHDVVGRTATGQVLYAARHAGASENPDCLTTPEWNRLRSSIREPNATVSRDAKRAGGNVLRVSADVVSNGRCAGAVTAIVESATVAGRCAISWCGQPAGLTLP